jgi:phosphate starvation-inducible PhoH-like protein
MTNALTITFPTPASVMGLVGKREENLKTIAELTGTKLLLRGLDLRMEGTDQQIHACQQLISALKPRWLAEQVVSPADICAAQQAILEQRHDQWQERPILNRTRKGEGILPRTRHQQEYVQSMQTHDLVFAIGSAGTGKTYLAAITALRALQQNQFQKIILTRPAVEAGEKLGFLPGDLQQKVDPYLRPLYDALHEVLGADKIPQMLEKGTIEIAPLAYMRGRTLSHAFIIVDEAQNTTPGQMKMILTRLGFYSRMVITGDITQVDLPPHQKSGLAVAMQILQGIEGIAFHFFDQSDIVRHPLVQKVITAFDHHLPHHG